MTDANPFGVEEVFALLPAHIRLRDAEIGAQVKARVAEPGDERPVESFGPLKTLVSLIAREGQVVAEELDALYDDHFIETCAPWVVPYLGDLLGVRGLGDIPEGLDLRARVANALPLRQRKGTLRALEHAAGDASRWPVVAREFWNRLVHSQSMRLVHPKQGATADLRDRPALARIGLAFETTSHGPEMRRIAIAAGRWNLPNIGLHAWRLQPASITGHRAERVRPARRDYRFHPHGCDAPLFARGSDTRDIDTPMDEGDVPMPITRELFAENVARFYGPGRSILVSVAGTPLPLEEIRSANLGDRSDGGAEPNWAHPPRADQTMIDPELGRLVLGRNRSGRVELTCHHGRVWRFGGGEHDRDATVGSVEDAVTVAPQGDVTAAANGAGGEGVALLTATGAYAMTGLITVPADGFLRIVAADGEWPTVNVGAELEIRLGLRARVELNGLRLHGGPVRISGTGESAEILDCTLTPGLTLDRVGDPVSPGEPALRVQARGASLRAERSILGPIQVVTDVDSTLIDCAIDAGAPENLAIGAVPQARRHTLRLRRCTVVGQVRVDAFGAGALAGGPVSVELDDESRFAATDTIFIARGPMPVVANRRQVGCLRFCYVPEGSLTPRLYRCVTRPEPVLRSLRVADPDYLLPERATPRTILRGAEDGGEMGVWNRAAHRVRDDNLRRTIADFLRFGHEAGVFHET